MTISHGNLQSRDDLAVVFAELMGFSCSICAPKSWDVGRVIRFAEQEFPSAGPGWVSIDKSKLGLGSPTPHPCNQYPDERAHWFMLRGEI